MTWFKIDDSFYDHPKVFDAPDCAVALWVRAGTWSARNLTDGFVPAGMPARLCDDPETAIRELIRRRLWSRTKDGYRFHDWTDYQPTREAKEQERAAAAERQRKRRERMKAQANADSVTDVSHRDSRDSHAGSHGVSSPAPTRPDPTRTPNGVQPPPTVGGAGGRRSARPATGTAKGTRLPDGFEPTADLVEWARENAPTTSRADHDEFVDYWRAQPGQKGVKADWPATWRNWMRRADRDRHGARPPRNGGTPSQHRPSTGDQRMSDALALAAEYANQERRMEIAS